MLPIAQERRAVCLKLGLPVTKSRAAFLPRQLGLRRGYCIIAPDWIREETSNDKQDFSFTAQRNRSAHLRRRHSFLLRRPADRARLQHRDAKYCQPHQTSIFIGQRRVLAQVAQPISLAVWNLHSYEKLRAEVDQRRPMEESLRASEKFKTRLIEGSHDCIKVLDLEGRLLSINAGGMKILEICDFNPLYHRYWLEFWPGEHRAAAQAAVEAAHNGGVGHFVGCCPTMLGKPMWWDVIVNPICDSNGKPTFRNWRCFSCRATPNVLARSWMVSRKKRWRYCGTINGQGMCANCRTSSSAARRKSSTCIPTPYAAV